MNGFTTRDATIDDIPFLVDTIIAAEKSGTETLSYSTVFGLSEQESRKYIADMLTEEVDGCELSLSSFLLAEKEGQVAAAIASWVEGEEGMPSSILKSNLLNYTLPKENIQKAMEAKMFLKDLALECEPGTLQLGLVYVSALFRGQNLVNMLIEEKIRRTREANPAISEMYVQVFGDNLPAIKSYEKAGFKTTLVKESPRKDITTYLPGKIKLLMKKELSRN